MDTSSPRPRAGRAPSAPQRRRRRGQAVVEFAIILPVFALLMLIAIDVGRLFLSYIDVSNAAREGAAYAAGNPTDTAGILTAATQETNSQNQPGQHAFTLTTACTDSSGTTIACSTAAGGAGAGNRVVVTVREPFTFFTPLINTFFGNNLAMSTTASSAVLGLAATAGGTPPPACSPPTLASFTATPAGLTVTLDASASLPNSGGCAIETYDWDMGDGANPFPPVVGQTASYTYAFSGTYTVSLTVSNSNPTSLTTAQSVTVSVGGPTPTPSPAPTPTPGPTPTPVCSMAAVITATDIGSGKITFTGSYTGQPQPTSWSWNFDTTGSPSQANPATSTLQAPGVVQYPVPGSNGNNRPKYTVQLTITKGSCTAIATTSVQPSK
ncbi:MAG TPA: PKD domain-containing protein [Candidatus Limnocylindrales bacterium]